MRANLAIVAGLLALLALVSATAPRWAGLFRREAPAFDEEAPASAPGAAAVAAPTAAAEAERKISVKLFFVTTDAPRLALEERTVPLHPELSGQIRLALEELVKGSQKGLLAPLPPDTRVLEVFVSPAGVAYVDLSAEVRAIETGSANELLAVYALVNSVAASFPAVKRVQILVDDRPAATLAGHVDVSRPLPADMTLLVASSVAPVAGAPAERPGPPPSPRS